MALELPPVWEFRLGIVGTIFFGACLFMALFRWEKARENMRRAGSNLPRPVVILASLAMIGASVGAAWVGYTEMPPNSIGSLDDARRYAVGTWVYAEPLDRDNQYVGQWIKWVVHEDGNIDAYYAYPRDDSWGQPERVQGVVFTDKYDTGERYYAIQITHTAQVAYIRPQGLVYTILGNGAVLMRRGDRTPFSR